MSDPYWLRQLGPSEEDEERLLGCNQCKHGFLRFSLKLLPCPNCNPEGKPKSILDLTELERRYWGC